MAPRVILKQTTSLKTNLNDAHGPSDLWSLEDTIGSGWRQ